VRVRVRFGAGLGGRSFGRHREGLRGAGGLEALGLVDVADVLREPGVFEPADEAVGLDEVLVLVGGDRPRGVLRSVAEAARGVVGQVGVLDLLAEKDRGKFLLRRDRDLYFIAPGAARPVKLAPSYRLQGAALDELLGLRLTRDFRIAGVSEGGGVVTFDLIANDKGAAAARLRWVVSRSRRLPLRADLLASDGRVLRVIEFRDWRDAARGVPERMVVKEVLRGGAPLEIRFGAFEVRPVGRELFDLENGAARATLPLPDPAARAAPKGP
jgi:hypothetical protein